MAAANDPLKKPVPPVAGGGASGGGNEEALAALANLTGGGSGAAVGGAGTSANSDENANLPRVMPKPVPTNGNGEKNADTGTGRSRLREALESSGNNETLSASGFVNMLAKGNMAGGGGENLGVKSGIGGGMPVPARPIPRAREAKGAGTGGGSTTGVGSRMGSRFQEIHEAQEIKLRSGGGEERPARPAMPEGTTMAGKVPGKVGVVAVSTVPGWYHVMLPILITVGSMLMLVGMWGVLGTVARVGGIENVPLVPAVDMDSDGVVVRNFDYWVPFVMLFCLPVAGVMGGMGMYMKRQMRRRN